MVLAGLTPGDWDVTIVDENLGPPDYDAMPRPDLVGITAFTSQANRAYEVAAHYRRLGVPVVMGGIHAIEHAMIGIFPLFALCDRHDVAGISYVRHPQLGRAAVFYRMNAQSRALEEAFRLYGLPYVVVGGTRFFDRKEIRDLVAYLRLVAERRQPGHRTGGQARSDIPQAGSRAP